MTGVHRLRVASLVGAVLALGATAVLAREAARYRRMLSRLRREWTVIPAVASGDRLRIHARVSDRVWSATPAVLVHGYGVGTTYLVPLAAQLGRRMRVYAPDLPGHGPSDHDARPLSIPELADALTRWIDAEALTSVLLIGHSLGCQIAVEAAARRPDLVSVLMLIGPTADSRARTLRQHLGRGLLSSPFDRPSYLFGAALDYWRAGFRVLVHEMSEMLTHRIEDVLPRVVAPAVVVRGGRDFVVPYRWCATVAAGLRAPTPVTIPGWGHAVQYDAPEAIAAIAASMLARPHLGSAPA